MLHEFLHQHKDFANLIRIVGEKHSIDPVLVEKDYWIMHCLYGLKEMGWSFELKGGTSLSKGLGIIDRFSEDIDIRIEPPAEQDVATNPNQQKPAHVKSRKVFYDWLAKTIAIDGIVRAERDTEFDDLRYYRSGGIRLVYETRMGSLAGLKDGILLEVGFDVVSPNAPKTISSWAYDFAASKAEVIDNRAVDVACYHPAVLRKCKSAYSRPLPVELRSH
ncbi:nucleotidyl transferase AbiEii/AbiGii toxin family protein [Pseudovibrio sp. Tun.PSC04-5.I4]|uniref:nucleotidyl transferase AbiEii/AbiGii toxin family protein n=1 Tax=Pseudovibrio sp. Tun.PSC04-5.I4 TaxID=1798213 RepID=UPI00088AA1AA|nr:nucleotidyl transferase AbiEii/AbiGii toxin family protein [Pseudovibrio sp. Tun.PSC04-5.I4]SDR44975.1 Nucleotidyl transferase AbiEii toxin, Type IV TA system [Pseudovibrio sp. Tun.PSC04-5.I4]